MLKTKFMKLSVQLSFVLLICSLLFLIASAGVSAGSYPALRKVIVQDNGLKLEESTYDATTVKTLTFEGSYAAVRVYSNDDMDQSPADDVYEPEPDPEPEPEPDPDLFGEIEITVEKDQQYTGNIELPDGATVMIGVQPANGSARIDDQGNWDYTPNRGYVGEDEFTIVIEYADETVEVKTVSVTVIETDEVTETEDVLPVSGGFALAATIALWLFVIAIVLLRKGFFWQSKAR